MTLGRTPRQADLFRSTVGFCEPRVPEGSIYGLLHRECYRLFPDEMFADLFTDVGRRGVPPMIVAVVMVLQRGGPRRRSLRTWSTEPQPASICLLRSAAKASPSSLR